MKRGKIAALLCALLLILSSCLFIQDSGQPPEGAYALYFAVNDSEGQAAGDAAVDFEYRVLPEGQELVPALVDALLSGPVETERLTSPFPASVRLRSWEQTEDGGLHLDMTERYSELSGISLTIANYCLTLTLCQLEGVEYVHITVMGEALPFWQTETLTGADALLSGAEEQPVTVNVALYYPRRTGAGLGVEYRDVLVTEENALAEVVLEAYLEGPSFQSLQLTVPEGTELRSVTLESGVCYVNFSEGFTQNAPAGEAARLLVYSIVNTLGSLERVETVQLQVEGENLTEYGGVPTIALKPDYTLERMTAGTVETAGST